jgi:sugar lactone lactonase YvrE
LLLVGTLTAALLLAQAKPSAPKSSAGVPEPPAVEPQAIAQLPPPPEPAPPAPPAVVVVPEVPLAQPAARRVPPPEGLVQPQPPLAPTRPAGVVQHRRDHSEDDLRRQIAHVPEVNLDRTPEHRESRHMMALARATQAEEQTLDLGPLAMLQRPDLAGLPMRMGDDCHISPAAAEHLEGGALALRNHLTQATQTAATPGFAGDTRPDPQKLHDALNADGERHNKWLRAEAIPALQQLLMAENEAIREVLVEQLWRIEGKKASLALAQRALYDLNPKIREAAVVSLYKRPAEEYRQTLLEGFRHPWPVVADHAAEALAALGLKDTVPALVSLLDQPDPAEPYTRSGKEGLFVREMVRINHLRNCLLCHAPSLNMKDRVRGRVPPTDQPLPPPFSRQYYADNSGTFVRADVTYLQQDFSVPMQVDNPGLWPAVQRYDFLVRERRATRDEVETAQSGEQKPASEHQKALFFALRELTGKDPGPTVEDWKRLFLGDRKVTVCLDDLKAAVGVAADSTGRLFVSNGKGVLRAEPGARPQLLAAGAFKALAMDARGRLLACAEKSVVAIDPASGTVTTFADKNWGKPLAGPLHLAADRQGGVYFIDAPATTAAGISDKGVVYYASAQGVLTRLPLSVNHPTAVALSPDDKTLYVLTAGSLEVMAYPLEGVGMPGPGRVLCRLKGHNGEPHGGCLAVDRQGNLFATHPEMHVMQVFNPQGASLGQPWLPQLPIACTIGGEDGRTVHIATGTAVYALGADSSLVSR